MREYELLYIVSGALSEDDAAKATDEVNSALMGLGGKVDDENVWGRRRLAYQIDGQEHGWYVVTSFNLDGAKVADFEGALRLNGRVLRSLIVKASEVPTAEEAERAAQAAAEAEKEREKGREAPTKAAKPEKKPAKSEHRVADADEKKKETPEEQKARQAKLEEKLGELLKEE